MARNFDELASELKGEWSTDAARAHAQASDAFAQELSARRALGAAVADARRAAALTQIELAAASRVQQPEISRIERGLGNPTADTLGRLAAALGRRLTLEPA